MKEQQHCNQRKKKPNPHFSAVKETMKDTQCKLHNQQEQEKVKAVGKDHDFN